MLACAQTTAMRNQLTLGESIKNSLYAWVLIPAFDHHPVRIAVLVRTPVYSTKLAVHEKVTPKLGRLLIDGWWEAPVRYVSESAPPAMIMV